MTQDDENIDPNTSSYESMDSIEGGVVGVDFLRGKGITELEDKH